MKKLLALILSLTMLCALSPAAYAAAAEANEAADALHELGLFSGVGKNADGTPDYDLDRTMTRAEAVTMLVRLLGKEAEAKAGVWENPFTDVADWAKPYVGYAYANKLTSGTGDTTFSGSDNVTATQYLTFVLRALGYDSKTDFAWDRAWELTDSLGITNGAYHENSGAFLRGDAVIVSRSALSAAMKGSGQTLLDALGLGAGGGASAQTTSAYDFLLDFTRREGEASEGEARYYLGTLQDEEFLMLISLVCDKEDRLRSEVVAELDIYGLTFYIIDVLYLPQRGETECMGGAQLMYGTDDLLGDGIFTFAAPGYTGKDPIAFDEYLGDFMSEDSFSTVVTSSTNIMLRQIASDLLEPNGYTLGDLGFTAFTAYDE